MATSLSELVATADRLLRPDSFADYCPNGLQVEGRPLVRRLVSGVTASLALLEAALAADADAILVHHGYFWKNEAPNIIGVKRRRLRLLLEHEISLLVYHLPLDAHPQFGNNAQLAAQLDIAVTGGLQAGANPIGNVGQLAEALSLSDFAAKVAQRLGRVPTTIAGGAHAIKTIGWCTGGAQSYIEQAAALGMDAFLSGEISEQTVHLARELGLHFIAAGHHATERYGAPAVGRYLAAELGIEHQFIDIDNPA